MGRQRHTAVPYIGMHVKGAHGDESCPCSGTMAIYTMNNPNPDAQTTGPTGPLYSMKGGGVPEAGTGVTGGLSLRNHRRNG